MSLVLALCVIAVLLEAADLVLDKLVLTRVAVLLLALAVVVSVGGLRLG